MIPIKQDFIPVGRRNRPGYKLTPKYITIHTTANPDVGAAAHASYIKGDAAAAIPASWHFTVDDKEIYQHLPLTENGWHCGDGTNGTGNRQSIGVEICEYTNKARQDQAISNAAWLTAKLLTDYSLTIAAVKQHYDWSGKNCPRVLRARASGWQDFLAEVGSCMTGEPTPSVLPKVDKNIAVKVANKVTGEAGYLIGNATYVRAAYVVPLIGGEVTGHGDYINITLPNSGTGQEQLQTELDAVKEELDAVKMELTDAKVMIANVRAALKE